MESSSAINVGSSSFENNKEKGHIITDVEQKDTYSIDIDTNIGTDSISQGKQESRGRFRDFMDSFKPMPEIVVDPNWTDEQKLAYRTAHSPLKQELKGRHLTFLAIGGAIGTGLFIGSGTALRTGGAAGLVIGWCIMGTMIYSMVMALGEMAVVFPVAGSFNTYASRFIDESFGFATNINYMLQNLVVLPLEIVGASLTVNYWGTAHKYNDGFVALFWVVIVIINFFGVRGYAEAEFVFSFIKIITVLGFIILGIVLVCGGGPVGGYIGGKYWHNPGAFVGETTGQQFKGVCSVFVTAAFSFSGSELIGLASAESAEPRKSVPTAAKQVFWRITLFYIISLTLIGCLIPHNDSRLIGSSSDDATASPFVIALVTHGIKGLPSVVNVVILIAVLSVGNSAIYMCSRTLSSLSEQGSLPKIFGYIDRNGRPLFSIIFVSLFGLIAFVADSDKEGAVFNWLMALSGLSSLFTWGGICISHIQFRRALTAQGRGTDELAFASPMGIGGSIWGLSIIILVFIAQFYVAVAPIGAKPNASDFFQAYLSFPIVLVFYIGHKIWKKNWKLIKNPKNLDIDTGRRDTDLELLKQEIAEEKAIIAGKPWFMRVYHFWC
ncbi:similar to Saccharomyces cerevisiae YKR039W GAP1 General amino acid permease [Maudiozyma barnettii]|uniref:Similar to Saccharomyces cerevisiae YKR039W GAP1 General amino acid permease n=1 Tax=Maudiozyma barnettii TaxID=61262 RepID=A0A8H2VFJ3_9SACH|nr:amino acid permease GAP1 [Kazachstania barnettii]CAB4254592.1 similar to Saccharomyces cerevisiae YKR039W GAP1 General amino acid permease [Kazachstania barnettii]CAD1782634.1 similar to Saccharomyces cerevisiae YKR039W GAP1 General amino acid permease [Kazachstania barnettii]